MAVVLQVPDKVPATVAQQMFVIGSGIAGGLGGFILARKFSRIQEVSVPMVALTTIVSIAATLGAALYLGQVSKEV
jgi:hypothetical protein